jgi:hypothetical protein
LDLFVLAAGTSASVIEIFICFHLLPAIVFRDFRRKDRRSDELRPAHFRGEAGFHPNIRPFTWYTSSEVDKSNVQDD